MKERPILFSGPMVRAILDGRKTQTRRVVRKPVAVSPDAFDDAMEWGAKHKTPGVMHRGPCDGIDWKVAPPYGIPGDRLWVRETCWILGYWRQDGTTRTGKDKWRFVIHPSHQVRFDDPPKSERCTKREGPVPGWCRRPSIHMPRWASRILLDVVSVRVERLQSITEAPRDAWAEGCRCSCMAPTPMCAGNVSKFRELWDTINAARGVPWTSNPWVWVVEFRINP